MESDFLRNLVPLLFLIFWFIVKQNARKADKKKGAPAPAAPDREDPAPQKRPASPMPDIEGKLSRLLRELKEAADLQEPAEEKPTRTQPDLRHSRPEPVVEVSAPAQTPSPDRKHPVYQPVTPPLPRRGYSRTSPLARPSLPSPKEDITFRQLRTAFVWSEILMPPLALRRESAYE